ncbi:MAG: TonB-dependent receptor [candidate division KSB1 bacterium]|nr:TonB-dependent receptor [candidate division KSB1 bacterium]
MHMKQALHILIWIVALQHPLTAHPGGTGSMAGTVKDKETGEPVGFTYLLIDEIHFWQRSDSKGEFVFDNIPAGVHLLKTYRLGYQETAISVTIHEHDVTRLDIVLQPAPVMLSGVELTAHRVHKDTTLENPDLLVSDRKLRQNMGMTIANTLSNEPGLDVISMGPAPARPVLRGLGGDRLLLLEDGERTGDLSATSADHAVSIDPMTISRIEVIRGPEAFLYGSNVMGGVINVIREAIPHTRPSRMTGTFTLLGESVNRGGAEALELGLPVGPVSLRVDQSLKTAGDMHTPAGVLKNTSIRTANAALGASLVQKWGYIGASGVIYDSQYGIPPDPIAGHPLGVDIEMRREQTAFEGMFNLRASTLRHLMIRHQYSRYQHQELEASGDLGMEFGVVTHNLAAVLHFCHCGWLNNARIGFWGEHKDYASGGLTFTPSTRELAGALYFYNEYIHNRWSFNATVRYDKRDIQPDEQYTSRRVGVIRNRYFSGLSGALSGHYRFRNFNLGATVNRTFRAPVVEELFSEGPHLAAYSYQVGNADLERETGWGIDLFADYQLPFLTLHGSVFWSEFNNYLFPRNTGERSWRRADLYLYRYIDQAASISGFEGSVKWTPFSFLILNAQLQYVRGTLKTSRDPIPRIPPISGKVGMSYARGPLLFSYYLRGAGRQDRVGKFESPTPGYIVQDIKLEYLLSGHRFLHTLSVNIENIANTEYRRHLNRIKEIMPEAGRNIKLLYKVYF